MSPCVFELQLEIKQFTFLFLSSFHQLDLMIIPPGTVSVSQGKNGKPHTTIVQNKIFLAPNLLSLLNIPDEINRFGSPCLIWEMDHCGEGFLPQILPLIVNLNPNSMN
mgnify:CR=1 FL=1